MASRRCFAMEIVESDGFYDLMPTAQNLYFHLIANADDRGYVNNSRSVMRLCQATQEDMDSLFENKFILARSNGLIIIKGWRIHDSVPLTRIKETKYLDDLDLLYYDENNSYTTNITNNKVTNNIINNKEDKLSKDKLSKDKLSKKEIKEKDIYFINKEREQKESENCMQTTCNLHANCMQDGNYDPLPTVEVFSRYGRVHPEINPDDYEDVSISWEDVFGKD